MPKVTFSPSEKSICVEAGTTLLAAARSLGLVIESPCDGIGTCGKCKVRVLDGAGSLVTHDDRHKVSDEELAAGYVLACASRVQGDVTVEAHSTAGQNKTLKILSEGTSFQYDLELFIAKTYDAETDTTTVYGGGAVLGSEPGDTTDKIYGLAIDIGTTTLVTALIDCLSGEELGSVSALNPQAVHAQDVLTRIKFASKEEGLSEMYGAVTAEFSRMAAELCQQAGVDKRYIYEAVYSGNTTMLHLACGVNPATLGKFPYVPQIFGGNHIAAAEHGLEISPFGLIYLPPIITAFVGPDITSGVLAAQLHRRPGTTLFIDIGTNGEMVIARDGVLSATSTAAGPAFEGMNISCGMRAGAGAIEYFHINDDGTVELRTIQDSDPVGICGSGLFDIVGELARVGIVGKNGRFVAAEKAEYAEPLRQRLCKVEGKPAFRIAGEVYISQSDVRQVQLAKGAVRSGVEAMLKSVGVAEDEVGAIQIAGSFGYHLQAESLVDVALIPRSLGDRIEFVGNTSKSGAKAFLLNTSCRAEMQEVTAAVHSVELSNEEGFDKLFVECLAF